MHTNLLRRIASLPAIREVLGAAVGGAVALVLYGAFEIARGLLGGGVAHGTASFGLTAIVAVAGGCAFIHRRAMSEID